MSEHPDDNDQGGELIPARPDDRLELAPLFKPFQLPNNTVASVNVKDPSNRGLYITMKNGDSKNLMEAVNTVIDLVHFFFEPKRKVNETTGEIVFYPRFVLRCADGSQYSGGAFSVLGAVADLLLFRPVAPWDPPEKVMVAIKNLKGGRRVYNLIPVIDPAVPAPKKGGR